jgi:hypothetical protein
MLVVYLWCSDIEPAWVEVWMNSTQVIDNMVVVYLWCSDTEPTWTEVWMKSTQVIDNMTWWWCTLGVVTMDEGRERDNTSRRGGPPTLPGLYHSTIQPSQRGFFRVHVFV